MELQHLVVKIPVAGSLEIDPAKVVDIFHKWVAAQSMPGVILIDVAELLHVPDGPGVIAVGYEADYALDHTGGVWGILHRRKTLLPGTNKDRVAQAFDGAALAGAWLEEAFGGALKFSRTKLEIVVNDRGIAPNSPETAAAAVPEIEAALRAILADPGLKVSYTDRDARRRFGVAVETGKAFELVRGSVFEVLNAENSTA